MFGDIRKFSPRRKHAMVLKDSNSSDAEDDAVLLPRNLVQDAATPAWKLSFPHVLVASIVPFLFGYHLGVVNEPLETISIDLGFHGNTMQEGLVVSTCLAGAFVGSLMSGWIADEIGRRRSFQLCALPMLIGASICATANSLTGMLVGRFLVGIGLGVGPPVASLYVTEISPANVRGTYGSFIQIATCLGLMGALLIGIPVRRIIGWWRICFWLSTIPASLLVISMIFCVESPQWLYKQGREGEAEADFEKILGISQAKAAMLELSKSDRGDEGDAIKMVELLCGRHSRVVFIGSTLFALQQLSGINAVFYFSSTVFRRAGVSSNLANVAVGIANLIGSVIALGFMDKLGRKALLLWSFFGMAVSMVLQVLAAALFASDSAGFYLSIGGMLLCLGFIVLSVCYSHLSISFIPMISWTVKFGFVLMFAVGAGPVPGLLLPEIFPSRIRARAMALCMSVHWVLNFLVGLLFLRLLDRMGPQLLYSMFGAFCLLAVLFVKQNVVETKGKSLQEIEVALLPRNEV